MAIKYYRFTIEKFNLNLLSNMGVFGTKFLYQQSIGIDIKLILYEYHVMM